MEINKDSYFLFSGGEVHCNKVPSAVGEKYSAKGLVCVQQDEQGKLFLKQQASWEEFNDSSTNLLRTVYKDGQIVRTQSLNDIRKLMAQ